MTRVGRFAAAAVLLLVLPAGAVAGEKQRLLFRARPADAYPARDSHDGVIVAAEPFHSRERIKPVFGKQELLKAGILPVLLVITNNTEKAVRLDDLSVQLITADHQKIQPTPAETVLARLRGRGGAKPQDTGPSPLPRIPRSSGPSGLEVQVLAFSMRMAPPGSSASGFFYFDLGRRLDLVSGSKVYVTQLFWAHNSQPLMYFEMNLDDALGPLPVP